MGTYDVSLYTAACDVCDQLHGDPEDFGWDWYEFSGTCESAAIRAGWTLEGGLLVCTADDDDHQLARGISPDGRPLPGPGQIELL